MSSYTQNFIVERAMLLHTKYLLCYFLTNHSVIYPEISLALLDELCRHISSTVIVKRAMLLYTKHPLCHCLTNHAVIYLEISPALLDERCPYISSTAIVDRAMLLYTKHPLCHCLTNHTVIRRMFEMNCLLSSSSISTWGTIKTNTYLYRAIQYLHNGV